MNADDPRHGEPRGYGAGCRQECCLRAKVRYDKRRRWEARHGLARRVPSRGSVRRFRALRVLGWSSDRIAEVAGIHPSHLRSLHRYPTCYRSTHLALAAAYERLCMKFPPATTTAERHAATKVARCAARNGYAPPLAWDDIDTDEHPSIGGNQPRDLLAEWEWLRRAGESIDQAAKQLGVTVGAIERAGERARGSAA